MALDKTPTGDKRLEVLHDHYKETFVRVREMEASRDRLFLWLIGLFTLLSLEIGYPAAVGKTLEKVTVAGGEINLGALPFPALLHATWMVTLVIGLRYCQATIWVTRQYDYVHSLEDTISPLLGGGDLYRREGHIYLRKFPLLLDVAWIAYGFLFPLVVIAAAIGLAIKEVSTRIHPRPHVYFDLFLALILTGLFFLYRVQPSIVRAWEKWRVWWPRAKAWRTNLKARSAKPRVP